MNYFEGISTPSDDKYTWDELDKIVDNIIFDNDECFGHETLWEFVSETFREYIEHPENLKRKSRELYDLIREVVE